MNYSNGNFVSRIPCGIILWRLPPICLLMSVFFKIDK